MTLPARPTLAAHVRARRHVVGGRTSVVLHDTRRDELVSIGEREWALLAAADGTRDVDGIVLAAAREGSHARAGAVVAFLSQLERAGMLAEERDDTEGDADQSASEVEDRPLEELPGFTLVCDGSGSCCRLYGTVLFGPVEAARARALMPDILDAERHDRVFLPERGSAPTAGSAVTLVDGRCAYLGANGRCGLHAIGGAKAKPMGCAVFPAVFVDDGEVIRVSASPECACVLASAGRTDGEPLVSLAVRRRSDLDPKIVVGEVPADVLVVSGTTVPRAHAVAFGRELARILDDCGTVDAASLLSSVAGTVATHGLGGLLGAVDRMAPPSGERVAPWLRSLHDAAARRARDDATWRSERDLARRASGWIADATARLVRDGAAAVLAGAGRAPASESLYLRALVHGHQLFRPARPVVTALMDRAVRILVARALTLELDGAPEADRDPACKQPLALVEAMLRGHGLDDDLEGCA